MKTVSVALVLCLNIGVDPPDTMKISRAAHAVLDKSDQYAKPQERVGRH